MRRFLKLIKYAGLFFLLLFLLTSTGLLTVWFKPSLVVNNSNTERLIHYANNHGIPLYLEHPEVEARSDSFNRKEISIRSPRVCTEWDKNSICFRDARLVVTVEVTHLHPLITVKQLQLKEGTFFIRGEQKNSAAGDHKPSNPSFWPTAPRELEYLAIEEAQIEVKKGTLQLSDFGLVAQADLRLTRVRDRMKWAFNGSGELWRHNERYRLTTRIGGTGTPNFGLIPNELRVELGLKGKRKLALMAHLSPASRGVGYRLKGRFTENQFSLRTQWQGTVHPQGADAEIAATATGLSSAVPQINLVGCRVKWELSSQKAVQTLKTYCPAKFTGTLLQVKNSLYDAFSTVTPLLFAADLKLEDLPERPNSVSGNIEARIAPLFRSLKRGKAIFTTELSGQISDLPRNLVLNSRLRVDVEDFKKVVALFKNYSWAIPSPLNELDGRVAIEASGTGRLARDGGNFPVVLKTRLSSKSQRLDLDGLGEFQLKPLSTGVESHLKLKLAFTDVKLVLPHFNLKSPPRIFLDRRIKGTLTPPEESSASRFSYDITLLSPSNRPVRLASNLTKDLIPLAINTRFSSTRGTTGTVQLLPLPVEMFRRKATIKNLQLRLHKESRKTEVRGEVEVVYTDYTIRILIAGFLQRPQVSFVSTPPLPQDKLIALLLFGKSPDELNEVQASSVGGTRAAAEDSAISLASMYILASTPIESVGYDPASRVFNAKVHLADGTSLNVGSNMSELNQVGIRKRLGAHWTVATYLDNPLDPFQRTVTAFLEWSKGY